MKKILITGANSYIGTSFENYIKQWSEEYSVDTVDMIDGTWREKSFAGYDVVFHVAGIAHRKETKENEYLYYTINRDLAIEVANKAKKERVKQFVFLSSMSVYGIDTGIITRETLPKPKSNYGKSKLQAETAISRLSDTNFKVVCLRPPMVYGKDCKGNFQTVIKLVKMLSFFPKVNNQRSMIYIDNLCAFVKMCIDKKLDGIYFPQNSKYVNTSDMAVWIAKILDKKIYMSRILGFGVKVVQLFVGMARKGFGTLIYKDTEEFEYNYCVFENEESVMKSV